MANLTYEDMREIMSSLTEDEFGEVVDNWKSSNERLFGPDVLGYTMGNVSWVERFGVLPTHDEAEEYIKGMIKFYSLISPDHIQDINSREPEGHSPPLASSTPKVNPKPKKNPPGVVYVIHDPKSGLYKIGLTTKGAQTRIAALMRQFDNPYLSLKLLIPTLNVRGLEQELHNHFNDKHDHREWFQLDDNDLEWIRESYDVE